MRFTSQTIVASPDRLGAGIVEDRRSTLSTLVHIVRGSIKALPAACYEERMVLTRVAGRLRVYVSDPVLVHEVLVRNADALTKSEATKRVLGAALGEGLLTADGATWRWQRQALAPVFQHDRLALLLPAMIAAAERTRDAWLAKPTGSLVDVSREMMRTTFAIILDTMLSGSDGIDAAKIERSVDDFLGATSWMVALAILKAPHWVPFPGRARAAVATRIVRASVEARIAARRKAGGGSNDLIDMLLAARDPEAGHAMADKNIADNILTFIAAGHETTAVAMTWTFALLANQPACVERLLAEIEEVTGGGPILPEHVTKLVYSKQVVSEAMRLYPPVPITVRTSISAFELGGVTLPAGSLIVVPIHALHRHRALWPEPTVFNPNNFTPEAVKARHRFAFMPFGAGSRVCIGNTFASLEAVAILAVLLQALRLERIEDGTPEARLGLTLRPRRPLRMSIVPHLSVCRPATILAST